MQELKNQKQDEFESVERVLDCLAVIKLELQKSGVLREDFEENEQIYK